MSYLGPDQTDMEAETFLRMTITALNDIAAKHRMRPLSGVKAMVQYLEDQFLLMDPAASEDSMFIHLDALRVYFGEAASSLRPKPEDGYDEVPEVDDGFPY